MNSWKVENPGKLLSEVKRKFLGNFAIKELKWSIENNHCFVNQRVERFGSRVLKKGDLISIVVEKRPGFYKDEKRVLFEDSSCLVYDKPAYLSSEELATITKCLLVHRLDRGTSGLILLAKNPQSQMDFEQQFKQRKIAKQYLAIVSGYSEIEGMIKGNMAPIHRREGAVMWGLGKKGLFSQTHFKRLYCQKGISLLRCIPITGRTHQIRVHLKHIGHPILGDYTYFPEQKYNGFFRPLLHAYHLSFTHPCTKETLRFTCNPPSDFPFFRLFGYKTL